MKNRMQNWQTAAALSIALLASAAAGAQRTSSDPEVQLKAASQKELLDGDLKGAIALYEKIVDNAKANHAAAAKALLEMGRLYGKLGNAEGQKKSYGRVLAEYGDQKDAVALARTRLGADPATGSTSRTLWTPTDRGFLAPTFGTLSSNGRFFSFTERGGDIFIRDVASGVDRNFTNRPKDSREHVFESVISSDGRRIASVWKTTPDNHYKIRIANLTGDPNTRTLYDTEDHPDVYDLFLHDWSRDGKTLAVLLLRVDKTAQIGLLSVADRTMQTLQSVNWGDGSGVQRMRFSPDGKYLGYDHPQDTTQSAARPRAGIRDVVVLAVDGNREIPAVVDAANDTMVGWSPDGNMLLFASDRSGTNDLWAVSFGAGKLEEPPRRLRPNIGSQMTPIGLSDSGALYYYTTQTGFSVANVQLATFDFNTGRYSAVPLNERNFGQNVGAGAWSPDGKKFVLSYVLRDRENKDATLLQVRSDAGAALALLQLGNLTAVNLKAWTPDGGYLLVQARDTQKRMGIYRVDAQTGAALVIRSEVESLDSIAWLPGGASFLTKMGGGTPFSPKMGGIYRIDVQTGDMKPLVLDGNSSRVGRPTVSPDGRVFYYSQTVPPKEGTAGTVAFIERELATGKERELIRRSALETINLSPAGQYIAAETTSGPEGTRDVVLLIPTAGGPARELMRTSSRFVVVCGWAPDSRRLLVQDNNMLTEAEIWLVPLNGEPKKVVGDSSIPIKGRISVSPDGRQFLNASNNAVAPATSEVVVLENFLPKPTNPKK